jgi:hypothetical protein
MIKSNATYLLWICILCIGACAKEVTQEELIEAAVEIKLKQWQATQIKTCKENVIVEAEDYVDSLLVVMSLETKLDTIPKPAKPDKPPKPAFKQKPDSVIVDPIFKEE